MSKTIAISDLHGRSFSTIFYQMTSLYRDADYIVQLGDWFDTEVHAYSPQYQVNNFKQMIKIRKKNSNVRILLGNHDASYLLGGDALYSIHCFGYEKEIKDLIEENIEFIDYCFSDGKYLYSHAGITKTLLNDFGFKSVDNINTALHNKDYRFLVSSKASLLYKRFHEVTDHNLQYNDLMNNRIECKQVIGHYSSMGMQVMDNLYDIEDFKHANCVIFQ